MRREYKKRREEKKKDTLGVNAQKYSYAKEMSPLNKVIQAVHFEHAQMSKLWYVESPEYLPEGCTQLRAWQTLPLTPRETQKWGEAQRRKQRSSQQGRKGLSSAGQLTSEETPEVIKKMQEDYQRSCLWTPSDNSCFLPISVEQRGDKFAVQTPGRERDFHFP